MDHLRDGADLMVGVMHQALLGGSRKGTMIEVLNALGLQSGLQLCLDAGDAASYDGSSQTWTDRSGNGYSFYRGSGSGADAADPTFNGTSGNQTASEYFSFDGADLFTLNQANPSWVNNAHKNSAQLTIAAWVWINTTNNYNGIIGDVGTSGGGWNIAVNPNSTFGFASVRDDGNASMTLTSSAVITEDAWQFLLVSFDEQAGTGFLRLNGTNENKTATMVSPSSNNSDTELRIGCGGLPSAGFDEIESGGRVATVAAWSRVFTSDEATSLFEATRTKFGV